MLIIAIMFYDVNEGFANIVRERNPATLLLPFVSDFLSFIQAEYFLPHNMASKTR